MLPELERFASSLEMDYELYPYDVAGSIAHTRGLAAARLVSKTQATAIERGLRRVKRELDEGAFRFRPADEDIHTAIERRLTEITPAGASLHAGRSRNDQVALDLRLFCRDAAAEATVGLAALVETLASKALTHAGWLMPGYTHLQRAQAVTLGHHLLAHAEPLLRDAARFRQAYESAGAMPLGSGALAATTLPLRRDVVARELGFTRLTENSIDAVSDRDFALDLAYACAVLAIHLSRLGEDIVLWASAEFGFVTLADEISTGSSLMPQKKNPDIAELLRGRAGRSLGSLVALATTVKGLPLAYDRALRRLTTHSTVWRRRPSSSSTWSSTASAWPLRRATRACLPRTQRRNSSAKGPHFARRMRRSQGRCARASSGPHPAPSLRSPAATSWAAPISAVWLLEPGRCGARPPRCVAGAGRVRHRSASGRVA